MPAVDLVAPARRRGRRRALVGAIGLAFIAALLPMLSTHQNAKTALRNPRAHGDSPTTGEVAIQPGDRTEALAGTTLPGRTPTTLLSTTTHVSPTTILAGGDSEPVVTAPPVIPDPLVAEYSVPASGGDPAAIAAGFADDLWFTVRGKAAIGRVLVDGTVTVFPLPNADAEPVAIVRGPDGAMWFGGYGTLGRITSDGEVSLFANVPFGGDWVKSLAVGSDGAVYAVGKYLARIATSGVANLVYGAPQDLGPIVADPTGGFWVGGGQGNRLWKLTVDPVGPVSYSATATLLTSAVSQTGDDFISAIAAAPDNSLWFTWGDYTGLPGHIAHRHTDGTVTTFSPAGAAIQTLTVGPDGNVWFADNANRIGRMTPAGSVRYFSVARPAGVAGGPDGSLWFTEGWYYMFPDVGRKVGRIDLSQL